LPYLACISDDYAILIKMNVIALSSDFSVIFMMKKPRDQTIFLLHLYSLFKSCSSFKYE